MRLWGKAVTLGYTTEFATAAYGEQVELTLPATTGPSPLCKTLVFKGRNVVVTGRLKYARIAFGSGPFYKADSLIPLRRLPIPSDAKFNPD